MVLTIDVQSWKIMVIWFSNATLMHSIWYFAICNYIISQLMHMWRDYVILVFLLLFLFWVVITELIWWRRYCLAVSVIGFAYSGFQACNLSYHLISGKYIISHPLRYYFDFAMDQASTSYKSLPVLGMCRFLIML